MRLLGCECSRPGTRESEKPKPKPKPRATRLPEQTLDEGAEGINAKIEKINANIAKINVTMKDLQETTSGYTKEEQEWLAGCIKQTFGVGESAEAKNAIASSSKDLFEKKKASFLKKDEQIEKAKASSEEFSPKECIKVTLGISRKEEQIEKATASSLKNEEQIEKATASSLKKEKMQQAFVQVMIGDVRRYEDQKRVDSVWCPKNNMWVKEVSGPSPTGVKADLGTSAAPEPEPEPEPEPPATTDWVIPENCSSMGDSDDVNEGRRAGDSTTKKTGNLSFSEFIQVL